MKRGGSAAWVRTHRKLLIAASVTLVALILVLLVLNFIIPHKVTLSKNPSVAEYQRQLPVLKDSAAKNPKDTDAQKNYAIALYASGDIKAAKAQYEKVLALNPADASAYNYLANAERDLGQTKEAVASYQKAIELDPKQTNYYANLANVQLYSLNTPEDAIVTYTSGLKAVPNNSQLEYLLGSAYEKAGKNNQAQKTYEHILTYEPTNQLAKAALERLTK